MATNSLQSLHHHSLIRRHSLDTATTTTPPPSIHFSSPLISLKPNTTYSLSTTATAFSLSTSTSASTTTTSTTPSKSTTTLDLLEQHLTSQNFRQADDETRRLLIALAGEAAQKRGYVFFSETKFISETDLIAIDELWKKHSNNRFGYSVQKKIWEKSNRDFTKFFIKLGWMKKLDSEVLQYNYRAFPNEFIWELNDETPMGHLPLTNALRGTQLFSSILTHPAFDMQEEDGGDYEDDKPEAKMGLRDGSPSKPSLSNNVFKNDYSF